MMEDNEVTKRKNKIKGTALFTSLIQLGVKEVKGVHALPSSSHHWSVTSVKTSFFLPVKSVNTLFTRRIYIAAEYNSKNVLFVFRF